MSGLELGDDGDSSDGEWNFQPVPRERRGSVASSATSASSAQSSASAATALAAPSPVEHKIEVVPQVARLVAQMRITNPEVLRVTRAHQAFENCATAFRAERSLHHKSWKSERISRFWSHSWHGSAWAKVATLLVLYNGLASVLLGTCAALVMMCLFSFRLLPGFSRAVPGAEDHLWSTWSVATGLVVSVAVFILWKPRQLVFFDRLCISEDPALKASAIFSLAGMLKNSNEMLVLWDPSWSDRLWCLFELAAFLKCKKADTEKKLLIVRPTFVGPCSIAVFLTVCAAMLGVTTLPMPLEKGLVVLIPLLGLLVFGTLGGFFAVMAFRAYFRSVQLLEKKLLSRSFDTVRSSCCDMDHVGADGRPIICDREVVEQCVTMWFGSIQAFEESIRSELLEVVTTELRQGVFTKGWALQVSTPILWALMDIVASQFSFGQWENAVENSVLGLLLWLICAPMLVDALILLTRRFCNTATGCGGPTFSDSLLKLAVLLVMILICGLMCAIYLAVRVCFNSSTGLIRAIAASGAFLSLYAATIATKSIYAMCTHPARA
eukprot:Skav228541  [mRNA]  locus=scaffold1887:346595:348247:+ [translate_table: standard]